MRKPTYAILLFLFVLSVVGPLIHPYADQQASRYALTAALWDNRTVDLDGLEHTVGRDAASKDGHLYSDKAPLQPFLAVPFYAAYRAVGGESAAVVRSDFNLGLWWQTLWLAAVPLALMAALLARLGQRVDSSVSVRAALAVTFGTILLPFGAMLFGHALAALFLLGAVYLLAGDELTVGHLVGAGALAGAAVATEYPTAIAVMVISAFVLWKVQSRSLWFVLGGVPFAAFLGIYHSLAFGSPLSHPYTYNVFSGVVTEQKSFFQEFNSLQLGNLFKILFSGRGFVIASPIVLVGIAGLVHIVWRRRGAERAFAAMSLGVFLSLLMVPLFWGNPWGGFSPGPRYLAPALPLLVTGVVAAWTFRPFLTRVAIGVSVTTMVLATITNPMVDKTGAAGIGTWLRLAGDGDFVDTVFTMAFGNWGWLLHGAIVGALGWLLYREVLKNGPASRDDNSALQPKTIPS